MESARGCWPSGFTSLSAPDVGMTRVLPRHQGRPRWRTDGCARIKLRKLYSFFCQPVDVRRFDKFLTIKTHIAIAEIVGQNKNDIGTAGLLILGVTK